MPEPSFSTLSVHSGTLPAPHGVISPIYPATVYTYLDADENTYPRYFNLPNQQAVERKLAALERGETAIVFSSGMAAISTTLLSLLRQGDHAVFQAYLYGGTAHFIRSTFERFGIAYTFTEGHAVEDFERAMQSNTKLLYGESPSNPLLNLVDLRALAGLAASRGVLSLIDNTFATPINQTPLDFGIDVVMHSATKYLGGHSDLCAGAVVARRPLVEQVRQMAVNLGGSLDPGLCAQLERSVKTLAVRIAQQNANAGHIAAFLREHDRVQQVFYPGLEDHPGHDLAQVQMRGFGGMLSFECTDEIDARAVQERLRLIMPAMSLGGVESTMCSPALTSHVKLSAEQRTAIGISDGLLRLSVGIENPADLIADLDQALCSEPN